jgi:heat-inducible transcriptional repressor
LRHLELISLQPRVALLILVTFESTVRQMMIHLPEAAEQAELSRLADTLAADLRGMSSDEIAAWAGGSAPLTRSVVEQLAATLHSLDSADQTEIHHSGLENIVGQPDVGEGDLQSVMGLLRGGGFLSAVLPQLGRGPDVQVFIGDQSLPGEFRRFGVVVSTYGVDGVVTGVLGLLGPMRMSYWRSISTVRYMASLMSDLMADLYPKVEH